MTSLRVLLTPGAALGSNATEGLTGEERFAAFQRHVFFPGASPSAGNNPSHQNGDGTQKGPSEQRRRGD